MKKYWWCLDISIGSYLFLSSMIWQSKQSSDLASRRKRYSHCLNKHGHHFSLLHFGSQNIATIQKYPLNPFYSRKGSEWDRDWIYWKFLWNAASQAPWQSYWFRIFCDKTQVTGMHINCWEILSGKYHMKFTHCLINLHHLTGFPLLSDLKSNVWQRFSGSF